MNRSQKAARYGALAEKVARERYGLVADRDSWHDALDGDGLPWDCKACMLSRPSPRFRLWREQHERLEREGGGYVFIAYVPRGAGIQVRNARTVRAADLTLNWYGSGEHPKGDQKKVRPSRVF